MGLFNSSEPDDNPLPPDIVNPNESLPIAGIWQDINGASVKFEANVNGYSVYTESGIVGNAYFYTQFPTSLLLNIPGVGYGEYVVSEDYKTLTGWFSVDSGQTSNYHFFTRAASDMY